MNVLFWNNFTKRKNSTLTPAGGALKSCVLKDLASVDDPVLIINDPMPLYTYVYIPPFQRYYFVTDIVNIDNSMSEIHCTVDVLASFRASILSYTAFVERSSSKYDEYINDPLLTGQQLMIKDDHYITALTNFFDVQGSFVLEVMNGQDGIILYVMPELTWINKILMPGTYTTNSITEWIDSKIAQAFDLDVYIGTVKWMPFSPAGIGAVATDIFNVGPIGVTGDQIDTPLYKVANRNTAKHMIAFLNLPQDGFFNDFRDTNDSYTQYTLTLPGVGFVPLNADFVGSVIKAGLQIAVNIYVDLISGDVTYDISSYEAAQVNYIGHYAQFKGNVSVDVPIGKSAGNPIDTMTTFLSGNAGGITSAGGNPVGAAAGILSSDLQAISNNIRPQVSMVGGRGNKSDMRNHTTITLTRRQYGAKEYPQVVAGRPLYQNVQLSTLSGFCKCGNASVPLNANDGERDAVNSYLNSGFYIE